MTDHTPDGAVFYPWTERNRDPILEILRQVLPEKGLVLEIGSGSGQHVAHFAVHLPGLTFQPTEPDSELHASISAWVREAGAGNVLPPLVLDAASRDWPVEKADAIVCANVIHISPWQVAEGIMAGAQRLLPQGGVLYLYGPYNIGGAYTSEGNRRFDADLKARDPRLGLRDVEEVIALAAEHGLDPVQQTPMPANNLSVVLFKR